MKYMFDLNLANTIDIYSVENIKHKIRLQLHRPPEIEQKYIEYLQTIVAAFKDWKTTEIGILKDLNIDISTSEIFPFMDSFSPIEFSSPNNLADFNKLIKRSMDSNISTLTRAEIFEQEMSLFLYDRKLVSTIKHRCIYFSLKGAIQYNMIPYRLTTVGIFTKYPVIEIASTELYNFWTKYPWMWIIFLNNLAVEIKSATP